MKKLLHIIATPRDDESRTLRVSRVFLDVFKETHPSCGIDEEVPVLTVQSVEGKYALLGGKDLSGEMKDAWQQMKFLHNLPS